MKRRYFIQAATVSVLCPAAVTTCIAALTTSQNRGAIFFDERFPQARHVAASRSASNRLIAVQSDVTTLWCNGLDRMTRNYPLHLHGVTTESFLFCLRILVSEHADLELRALRLDRNLFQWTMCTTPKLTVG
jgi:hypothetical protein